MKLDNKVEGFESEKWTIPLEEGEGYIESISKTQNVLGQKQRKDCTYVSKFMKMKKRGEMKTRSGCEDGNRSQIWLRSKSDDKGFFTLKNLASGLVLTSKGTKKYTVTGMSM